MHKNRKRSVQAKELPEDSANSMKAEEYEGLIRSEADPVDVPLDPVGVPLNSRMEACPPSTTAGRNIPRAGGSMPPSQCSESGFRVENRPTPGRALADLST